MIDHISILVTDLARARDFYSKALAPLGYTLLVQIPNADQPFVLGFGEKGKPDVWIAPGEKTANVTHLALRATSRNAVRAFHAAGLEAGGKDNGGPGVRAHYHPNYFGAFITDPDGHNIEAVCHDAYLE